MFLCLDDRGQLGSSILDNWINGVYLQNMKNENNIILYEISG